MTTLPPPRRDPITPALHCSVEDQRRLLAASAYFHFLSNSDIVKLQQLFTQRHYPEGSTIHLVGQPATRLSIVGAGSVKLVRSTMDGRDIVVELLTPGGNFGSLAELGDATYRETAIAHTECCILSTSAETFSRIIQHFPQVALDSLRLVATRLRDAQSTIEQLSGYPVEHRVVNLLLRLATRLQEQQPGAEPITLPLSRQDVAEMTGTTVESASRVLSELKKAGLIESGRRWIRIPDPAALADRPG